MKLETRASFGWPATRAAFAPCENGLVVHYDGASTSRQWAKKPHSACREYWQWCRNFHIKDRGWLDIGYSYGICVHGIVMEGRGWQRQQAAQPGGNSTWTSVTLMLGEGEQPSDAQLDALTEFRDWLRRWDLGPALRGHRDFISTSCPGAGLYALIKSGKILRRTPATLPTLRQGATGPYVKQAQELLRKAGFPLAVDGDFGAKTAAAVKKFKIKHGLDHNAILGKAAWAALKK